MNVLQYCNDVNLPATTSTKVGDGADGEVFLIKENSDRVIKLSILYEHHYSYFNYTYKKTYSDVVSVLSYLKNNDDCYVTIYDFGLLKESYRETVNCKQEYIIHYTIMEKLNKLSEDEKKVFHSILSHEDLNKNKNYSLSDVETMLNGLKIGLDFNFDKVILFYKSYLNSKIVNTDMHVRNIMKTINGNYKFIDIDRAYLK